MGAAKNLVLLSYEVVRSHTQASLDGDVARFVTSPMFDVFSACAKKCPTLLLGLSRDSQPVGEILLFALEAAPVALNSNEKDNVLSSIRFLKELASSLATYSLDAFKEDERNTIAPFITKIIHFIQ